MEVLPVLLILIAAGYLIWRVTRRDPDPALKASEPAGHIRGNGEFDCEVVGESHYQKALERIAGGRSEDGAEHDCIAVLVPEPQNKHDRNAIRVDIDGRTVGYLSRSDAIDLGKVLRGKGLGGAILTVNAMIVGGWDRGGDDRGHFGVRLDIPSDD